MTIPDHKGIDTFLNKHSKYGWGVLHIHNKDIFWHVILVREKREKEPEE